MAASATNSPAPPQKKSIFNKPAWAKSAPTQVEPDPADSTDFFRRSDRTFAIITAEQEARRKKRKAKKEQQEAARGSSREGNAKRQRTTDSADEEEPIKCRNGSMHREHAANKAIKDPRTSAKSMTRSPSPHKPRVSSRPLTKHREIQSDSIAAAKAELERVMNSNVVEIESDEEADGVPQGLSKPVAPAVPPKRIEINDVEGSDEEELFPELAQKARDEARRKLLQEDIPKGPSPVPPLDTTLRSPTTTGVTDSAFAAKAGESIFNSTRSQPPPPDPIVSIFVQSDIPDTTPFILNRKLHQRLKEVRQYWCKRQHFTPEVADNVILTWRGKRIFDVTSCAALGLEVNADGKVVIKGETNVFSDDDEDGAAQIHMEAMTEEMFEQRQRGKRTSQPIEEVAGDEDEVEEVMVSTEEQVRIILKSKGYKEFYLLVKPSTKVADIIKAFRSANKVPAEMDIRLHFDGEELDAEMTVSETELSDMDYVDVYVK